MGSTGDLLRHFAHLPAGGHTRLAPTPSGYLHAGNAINFIITHRLAAATGSRVLLRIDDLDAERTRPEYVEDIFRSLEWLGISWDEGPSGPVELERQWSQMLRLDRYAELVSALRAAGHLYACTCSRAQLRATGSEGHYPGTCRNMDLPFDAADTSWRMRVPEVALVAVPSLIGQDTTLDLAKVMGDPVIRQRNGKPAYQVASLADDIDHGITFIVRGADLLPSTACQIHISQLLGLSAFDQVRFLHHPLLRAENGAKLSKSARAASLRSMREGRISSKELWRTADAMLADL